MGYAVNMIMTISVAYPLSKKILSEQEMYAWFFIITMMFSGGLYLHL